jgi:hypothetical protein
MPAFLMKWCPRAIDAVVEEALGGPLPPSVLDDLRLINRTCNRAVHADTGPVTPQEMDDLWRRALGRPVWGPLVRLARALSSEPR